MKLYIGSEWCFLKEFEIVSCIFPRTKLEDSSLHEIASRFISTITQDLGSMPKHKAFDVLYTLCRSSFEKKVQAATTSLLCQTALGMLSAGVVSEELAIPDLQSIIVSGFDIGRYIFNYFKTVLVVLAYVFFLQNISYYKIMLSN